VLDDRIIESDPAGLPQLRPGDRRQWFAGGQPGQEVSRRHGLTCRGFTEAQLQRLATEFNRQLNAGKGTSVDGGL